MKKVLLSLFVAAFGLTTVQAVESSAVFPTGDSEKDSKIHFHLGTLDSGRISFVKEGARHIVKAELVKVNRDQTGKERLYLLLMAGGTDKAPKCGFSTTPDTSYVLSFDIKGQGVRVFVGAQELYGPTVWGKAVPLKLNGIFPIPLTAEWTHRKYYFSTTEKGFQVRIHFSFYGEGSKICEKPGDYFMISNLRLMKEE